MGDNQLSLVGQYSKPPNRPNKTVGTSLQSSYVLATYDPTLQGAI